jgi:hypothetical protein
VLSAAVEGLSSLGGVPAKRMSGPTTAGKSTRGANRKGLRAPSLLRVRWRYAGYVPVAAGRTAFQKGRGLARESTITVEFCRVPEFYGELMSWADGTNYFLAGTKRYLKPLWLSPSSPVPTVLLFLSIGTTCCFEVILVTPVSGAQTPRLSSPPARQSSRGIYTQIPFHFPFSLLVTVVGYKHILHPHLQFIPVRCLPGIEQIPDIPASPRTPRG